MRARKPHSQCLGCHSENWAAPCPRAGQGSRPACSFDVRSLRVTCDFRDLELSSGLTPAPPGPPPCVCGCSGGTLAWPLSPAGRLYTPSPGEAKSVFLPFRPAVAARGGQLRPHASGRSSHGWLPWSDVRAHSGAEECRRDRKRFLSKGRPEWPSWLPATQCPVSF